MTFLDTSFFRQFATNKSEMSICTYSADCRFFLEKIILGLLYFYLLIDTVNGFLVQNLGLPSFVSVLYKQFILLLVLLYAVMFEPKRGFWCFFALATVFLWALLRFLLVDNVHFASAFQDILKVIYPFVVALVVSKFSILNEDQLRLAINIVVGILILNVLATLLGVGHSSYKGDTLGAKGFFYAANSLSGIMVIVASVSLVRSYKKSITLFLCVTVFLLILSILIGTKGGILGVFLVVGLVVLFNMDAKGVVLFFFGIVGFGLLVLIMGETLTNNSLLQRLIYFYETGGIQRALFSGRVEKMNVLIPMLADLSFQELALGIDKMRMLKAGVTRVEFDWFDMQIYFGAIFTIFTYLGYLYVFGKFLIVKKNSVVLSSIIAFIVLFIMSSISGHIMFNAMVTPLLGLLIAAAFKCAGNSYAALSPKKKS